MKNKKRIILFVIIAVSAIMLGVGAALLFSSLGTGDTFRSGGSCAPRTDDPSASATEAPGPDSDQIIVQTASPESTDIAEETDVPNGTPAATDTATEAPVDPYEELMELADTSMMKDIVNILLIGVDYSTERETWSGKKEWHSDVMMVLAVNFDENRADLISLPRDTYATIPNVNGIYKLNASLNCGGGLYNADGSVNPKGLEKVCEAAEWMLGGIDVDYYYAVTMTSLKDLVDLCGGLEYDMDIDFKIQGRAYQKGLQHIDGQAFLDYCRVRKGSNGLSASESGDANRVNRQKKMLIALFKQMKADQLITRIPQIIQTFDGELYTNCTLSQTAALSAFAYNLDPNNIGMYSMSGTTTSLFQWNFCFTDQTNRVKIIKDVYDVDVKKNGQYTLSYGRYRWCDMLYQHYSTLLTPLTKYVQKLIDEDDLLPEFTPEPSMAPTNVPTAAPTAKPTAAPTAAPTAKPTSAPTVAPTANPTASPTAKPTDAPTQKPTDAPVTPAPTAEPTQAPTPEPTPAPTAEPTQAPTEAPTEAPNDEEEPSNSIDTIVVRAGNNSTRKYTPEQRALFEKYKTCIDELEKLHQEADKEAKKYRKGNSNSLSIVGQSYLKKLAEVQSLAIEVAKSFGYNKVKNFNVGFGPTASGWSSSPWAVNYGKDKKFNEVIVDFN